MTVKELKQKIQDLPDNMDVFIQQTDWEFKCGLLTVAEPKDIDFVLEDVETATETCLLLTDE